MVVLFREPVKLGEVHIRTSGPCLPKAVLSTGYNVKSTTYAHRSRVYVTDCDSNGHEWTPVGHIMATVIFTVVGYMWAGEP